MLAEGCGKERMVSDEERPSRNIGSLCNPIHLKSQLLPLAGMRAERGKTAQDTQQALVREGGCEGVQGRSGENTGIGVVLR